MQSSAFQAWLDGNHNIPVECGREDGEPFVVESSGNHHIPMNIIVFAHDENDAIELVKGAFEKCIEIDYKTKTPNSGLSSPSEKYEMIKELGFKVHPFDKKFAARVQWASNDGVVT